MRMKINIEPEDPLHVENVNVLFHNVSNPKPDHSLNIKNDTINPNPNPNLNAQDCG